MDCNEQPGRLQWGSGLSFWKIGSLWYYEHLLGFLEFSQTPLRTDICLLLIQVQLSPICCVLVLTVWAEISLLGWPLPAVSELSPSSSDV